MDAWTIQKVRERTFGNLTFPGPPVFPTHNWTSPLSIAMLVPNQKTGTFLTVKWDCEICLQWTGHRFLDEASSWLPKPLLHLLTQLLSCWWEVWKMSPLLPGDPPCYYILACPFYVGSETCEMFRDQRDIPLKNAMCIKSCMCKPW